MPVTPTYPGVYIEEVPSGVRTIMGVATSITAFIGRALRGPTDDPTTINSYAEFERIFGGLWIQSAMSYAVRDFFQNGGGQAIIIRLYQAESGVGAKPAKAKVKLSNIDLEAVYSGAWGNELCARVDHHVRPAVSGEDGSLLFNLFIRDGNTGAVEEFRNVSVESNHKRQVDKVLTNESKLVRVSGSLPAAAPTAHGDTPDAGKTIWDDNATATCVKVALADEASDGAVLSVTNFTGSGTETAKQGLYALEKADLFNILCIPPYLSDDNIDATLVGTAATYCEKRRAFLLVDPLANWDEKADAKGDGSTTGVAIIGTSSKNSALFFPRICMPNPLKDNQIEEYVPCGAVAGIFARTDTQRGVWKAPAGLEATLNGVPKLKVSLTDPEIGELNQLGINCLKVMSGVGRLVWGSRTLQGSDRLASEWKYIPIRRLALFLEESLYRGTQWVVFEPNDEPLWAQIRLNVGAFMHNQFRKGAFQGSSPKDAYFVKCDGETTTQNDRDQGIVNILVGFAPLKPAEFVIIKISQIAGQIET
ncbi:MAG: phage tail sheath subtilisin-like domain-containing protein [Anaerolineales bacterium]